MRIKRMPELYSGDAIRFTSGAWSERPSTPASVGARC